MRRRADYPITLFMLVALAPSCLCAQGIPVIDLSAIQQAQQNLQVLQQQVQQLQSLAATAQGLTKSIGQFGAPAQILRQDLSQSGIAQFNASLIGSLSASKGVMPGNSPADFSSFDGARQWVNNTISLPASATATTRTLNRQTRSQVAGETAADGYALALSARQQVAAQVSRAQMLANQVGAATNLREDLAANTAVMLAIHDEMAEIQVLFAALLASQSAARLAESQEPQ